MSFDLKIETAKRVVVKIGSSLLVDMASGTLREDWLNSLASDLARLKNGGADVLIVSSGAIALGRRVLGFKQTRLKLEESQAAAAVGQVALAHAWQKALDTEKLIAAQVLLTLNDTEERRRYLNARSTITALLARGAVPVINENDTVATTEIRYGDNDRLAARVASMISADCLVVLSDVDGLYTKAPDVEGAQHIGHVTEITPAIARMAGQSATDVGTGGMETKVKAARIAMEAGAAMVIASGRVKSPIAQVIDGARCTWFQPGASPQAARKRWIAATLDPLGRLTVDDGASRALSAGRSLLPAGVVRVEGRFAKGDAVAIVNGANEEIARGLVAYDVDEAAKIAGRKSAEIEDVLGYRGRDELIHRDDLVLKGM
ncbi:MAG: glutamate 5-kinase [Pseudomonadota bacterium]